MVRQAISPDQLVHRIAVSVEDLAPSERKVAKVVLADPGGIVHQTITEVAQAAKVSEPTVLRFCRSVGCQGFQSFKVDLAKSIGWERRFVHQQVQLGDDTDKVIARICSYSKDSISNLTKKIDSTSVSKTISILSAANRIEFYGAGASGLVAMDAQDKFFRFGISCVAYTDAHQQIVSASGLKPGDAVLAFSHTGRTRDLIHVASIAAAQGADVIAVTAGPSPLSEQCKLAIFTDVEEDNDIYTPAVSRLMQLVIVDILVAGFALLRGPEIVARVPIIKSSLGYLRLADTNSPVGGDERQVG